MVDLLWSVALNESFDLDDAVLMFFCFVFLIASFNKWCHNYFPSLSFVFNDYADYR